MCASAAVAAGAPHVSGIVLVALNPQPEPPGRRIVTESVRVVSDVDRVALNPQPEPPGITRDARKLLPPGPCREIVVKVEAPGAAPVTARATEIAAGKCGYDVAVPGARLGSMAKVTLSRSK
ncbi:MAG TPA: hypothetical protein VGT98_18065 [Candidatus Elarobacter sp.]|nr:hypothetical protein [Candidatus Elarobacter sp.]